MARSINQLKQELAKLEKNTGNLGKELREIYQEYLIQLSQSVKNKLILASYQISTQYYPVEFLELSLSQREKLQNNLKEIGKKYQEKLANGIDEMNQLSQQVKIKLMEQMLMKLAESNPKKGNESQNENEKENSNQKPKDDNENDNNNKEYLTLQKEKIQQKIEEIQRLEANKNSEEIPETITNPDELWAWHLSIEDLIEEILKKISLEANRYLQEAGILSDKLPAKILEMAIVAQESNSITSISPNLLNLAIETEKNEETNESNLTTFIAIRLRLAEIEFAEANVNIKRNQIKNLLAKIETIRQQFHKKQQECAIAEAEAAWRSSWYD